MSSRTAALLDGAWGRPGGATVMHDLRIPGFKGNIDHLVVAGRTIWVIDTKVWAANVYWRLGDRALRGASRFEPAVKETTSLAVTRLSGYLDKLGVPATFALPTVVVWPSSTTHAVSTLMLRRVGDAPVVSGRAFGWAIRSVTRTRTSLGLRRFRTADPQLVAALSRLLVSR